MAIGFPPKYSKDLPLGDLTPEQALILTLEVAEKLKWNITHKSVNGFIASKWSSLLVNEHLKVIVDDVSIHITSKSAGNVIIDWERNKGNVDRFTDAFESDKASAVLPELTQKHEELKPKLASGEDDEVIKPAPGFLSFFFPRKGYFVTPLLIDTNIILFLIMVSTGVSVLLPDSLSLLKWGANFRPYTMDGQWWRLFTCMFLHIGVFHLLLNMYALIYIGLLLEPYLGRAKFAAAYILTGLASSMASLYWHENTLSAGASGAIFGMYGVFVAMLTTNSIDKAIRRALLPSILIFVMLNLMNGVKSGIDNAAHVGGLVSGIAIGYLYYFSIKQPDNKMLRYGSISIAAVIVMILCVEVSIMIPRDLLEYQKKALEFDANEKKVAQIFTLPASPTKLDIMEAVDKVMPFYTLNIDLVKEMDKLNIPARYHEKDSLTIEYCNLKIQMLEMLKRSLTADNITVYKDSTRIYKQRIANIQEEMKNIKN